MADHPETEFQLVLRLLGNLSNRIVLDVGAGTGSFAVACLGAGAEHIYAFEPSPLSHGTLRRRFNGNPSVTVLEFALGTEDGPATVRIGHDPSGQPADDHHALMAHPDRGEVRWSRDIVVSCRALSSLITAGTIPRDVGLLKITTDGGERSMLSGLDTLATSLIVLEPRMGLPEWLAHPPHRLAELTALLAPLGYRDFVCVQQHDDLQVVHVNASPTPSSGRGQILFLHERVRGGLMPIVHEMAVGAHDRLLDRALWLQRESEKRLETIHQLECRVEILRDPEVRDGDHPPRGPWIAPADAGEAERLRSGRPRVSIVTPSFNQGRFLEQAIRSVLDQNYADLEYIVIDGGSTDDSVAIIQKYADRLAYWVSEKDLGQADALNKGITRATGDIVAWLNSDDFYYPGAIATAVAAFAQDPNVGLVYGRGNRVDEWGGVIEEFESTRPFDLEALVHGGDYILQPTTFMRRHALHEVGPLPRSMHFAFDWDLWIRLARVAPVRMLEPIMGASREYAATKTQTGRFRRVEEIRRLVLRHTGQDLSVGYLNYLMHTVLEALPGAKLPAAPRLTEAIAVVAGLCSTLLTEGRLRDGGPGDPFEIRPYADGWTGPQLQFRRDVPAEARFLWLRGVHDHVVAHVAGPLVLRASFDGQLLGVGVVLLPGRFTVCWKLPRRRSGDGGRHEITITTALAFVPSRFLPRAVDGRHLAYRDASSGFSEQRPPGSLMARTGWSDVTAAVVHSAGRRARRMQATLLALRNLVLIRGRRLAARMRQKALRRGAGK